MDEETRDRDLRMLDESERRLRALVTASADVVYLMSPDWSEMRLLWGRGFPVDAQRPIRTWLEDFVLPDDQPMVKAAVEEGIVKKKAFELEHRIQWRDDGIRWIFSRAVPLMDANGEITEWFGAAVDVTARKKAEEEVTRYRQHIEDLVRQRTAELRELENNFRNSVETSPLGIRIFTADGQTLYANQSLLDTYGFDTVDEFRSTPVEERYTPESYADYLKRRARRQHGLPVPDTYEVSIVRKDGCIRHLRMYRSVVLWDRGRAFQCVCEDITDRRHASERLEALSHRLLEVQEEERRNTAMELHDEIGQSLTALKLMLDRQIALADGRTRLALDECSGLVGQIVDQVRQFSLDLWPKMLDDLGLLSTMVWYFARYTERTGVEVDFRHSGLDDREFGPHLNSNVYRIVQEALTNVARHAAVSKVRVQARADEESIMVRIEDEGSGFDMENQPVSATTGLEGMRERARTMGGTLAIDSAPGCGSRLLLEIPLGEGVAVEN